MNRAFCVQSKTVKLGIQDSNLDKLSQSQLCYRYTNSQIVNRRF